MDGPAIADRRRLRALILGLLATGLLYLPPLSVVPRIQHVWLALLSAITPDPAAVASLEAPVGVAAGPLGHAAGWLAAALWLGLLLMKTPRGEKQRIWLAVAAAVTLVIASVSARLFGAFSVPVAGPTIWLLLTTAWYYSELRLAGPAPAEAPGDAAVRLARAGQFDEAWQWYRSQPASAALHGALYDIACAFEAGGRKDFAADVFYRIAQSDAGFRDVARRLVASSRSSAASSIERRPPRPFSELPAMLGRYELLEEIGHGSAGYVYLGRDPAINRIVALKVVDLAANAEADEQAEIRDRFLREAETAGRLNHPAIMTIFDVGETEGRAYIAMEYCKGRRLSDFTTQETLLPTALVLDLIARTADALHYAHKQNVVHRDIKPANIMYDSIWDSLKIGDFGIARLIDVSRTRTGVVLGTPSYMAPEQFEGENVNGHTDLFALGVSLYELLTGRLPFRGNSMTELMFVIANEPHARVTTIDPELPAELDPLLDSALAKEPDNRFSTGADMAAALRAVATQLG